VTCYSIQLKLTFLGDCVLKAVYKLSRHSLGELLHVTPSTPVVYVHKYEESIIITRVHSLRVHTPRAVVHCDGSTLERSARSSVRRIALFVDKHAQ
jgi:hypothetical protein